MLLPSASDIDVRLLSQVFNNTSAAYKFYWFISILEIYTRTGRTQITFNEIIARMIANAWYPIHYFKLSFGQADRLAEQCHELQKNYNVHIEVAKDDIQAEVLTFFDRRTPGLHQHLLNFSKYVPYRFLSPWFPKQEDADIVRQSQFFANNCPYALRTSPNKVIELNPNWFSYLRDNAAVLLGFCYWNLTLFLQARNPNVPDIPNKLIRPIERSSLAPQRKYWRMVFDDQGSLPCIYTGRTLAGPDFVLDHFIPWSFVAHDRLWNLLPTDSSINSCKGNRLPILERHLCDFARLQQLALRIVSVRQPGCKLLEDFLLLGPSLDDMLVMHEDNFLELYRKSLTPLYQIAENMGFERWTA